MRSPGNKIRLDKQTNIEANERTNAWTNAVDGQSENMMALLTLSRDKDMKSKGVSE